MNRLYLFILVSSLSVVGCVESRYDMTNSDLLKYSSVANKSYKTKVPLYFVSDHSGDEWSIDLPDWHVEQAAKKFVDHRVQIGNSGFFVYGIASVGTCFYVEKIVHLDSYEISFDIIYGRLLTGPHKGKLVKVSRLFVFDEFLLPTTPRMPKEEYIEELSL